MKAVSSRGTKCTQMRTRFRCIDNSGAKILEMITVRRYKGRRRTKPKAGVSDMVLCKVYTGTEKVRHEIHKCVIVRQRKEFRRPDGMRVSFEDNAAIVVDDNGEPKGTQIKGPIAKESVERFPSIGKIASMVI